MSLKLSWKIKYGKLKVSKFSILFSRLKNESLIKPGSELGGPKGSFGKQSKGKIVFVNKYKPSQQHYYRKWRKGQFFKLLTSLLIFQIGSRMVSFTNIWHKA